MCLSVSQPYLCTICIDDRWCVNKQVTDDDINRRNKGAARVRGAEEKMAKERKVEKRSQQINFQMIIGRARLSLCYISPLFYSTGSTLTVYRSNSLPFRLY